MSPGNFSSEAFLSTLTPEQKEIFSKEFAEAIRRKQNEAKIRLTSMELMVTERCNLACDYCFVTRRGMGRDMSPEVAETALHFLFDNAPEDAKLAITLFGGEPFLVMPFIREIVTKAKTMAKPTQQLDFVVTSNGTLITDEIAAFFAQNGTNILLSIDGTKEHHDLHRRYCDGSPSFDRVMQGLEVLKRHQPWRGVRMTVSPETLKHLASDVEWLNQQGLYQFLIGLAECPEVIWSEEDVAELETQIRLLAQYYRKTREEGIIPLRVAEFEESLEDRKKSRGHIWGCEAVRTKLCIAPDGKIVPCARFVSLNNGEGAYILGDVFDGITRYDLVDDMQDNRGLPRNACTGCEYAEVCTGTCPAVNLEMSNNIYCTQYSTCNHHKILNRLREEQPDLFQIHVQYPIQHARTFAGEQCEPELTSHIKAL
jgi:uncharacterized protein